MTREKLIEKATEYWENYDFNVAGRVIINAMTDFALSVEKEAFKAGFLSAIGHPAKQEWIDKAYKEWKEAEK